MSITPGELAEWRREWKRAVSSGLYQVVVKNALRLLNAYEAQEERITKLEAVNARRRAVLRDMLCQYADGIIREVGWQKMLHDAARAALEEES